jgi:hypothetical protein
MTRSASPKRPIDQLAYPNELEHREAELIARRRINAGFEGAPGEAGRLPDDTLGFGLSGGGVRSATFSLGVFQALAHEDCLERVDIISTVSGGGYFGSFLGRLYSRSWVTGVPDVKTVLAAQEPRRPEAGQPPPAPPVQPPEAWAARVFRWLRDNGRYLAPRGSGDVVLLGAILLRNWVAVQTVLVVTMLTAFALLQIGRIGLEWSLLKVAPVFNATAFLVCGMPLGNWLFWWSPWLMTPVLPLALVAAPAGWAYWLVSRDSDGMGGAVPASVGAAFTFGLAVSGIVHYYPAIGIHPARLALCVIVAVLALIALLFYGLGEVYVRRVARNEGASVTESGYRLRSIMNRWLKSGLVATGILLGAALIDTIGGTLYAVSESGQITRWTAAVVTVFGAIGAFARPLSVLLAPRRRSSRPGVSMSTLSWIAAVTVVFVWLVCIDVASQALRWGFADVVGQPVGLGATGPATKIFGVDELVVSGPVERRTITANKLKREACIPQPPVPPAVQPFLLASTGVLAIFTALFGQTRRFANLSSVHGFYTSRLTRTFLGASNEERLGRRSSAVSSTMKGDDCAGDDYWKWPCPDGCADGATTPGLKHPWESGGPLHLLNVTVNETVDARSGIQNQDRKGIGLAIGPAGLSLGIRHHLVGDSARWQVFPRDRNAFRVFKEDSRDAPEPLSLGRWMSISGAAFSAAAGANTTVPLAILCGMFNVRLGYWWNSGTGFDGRPLARLLPVQTALFDEMFARTHGTAGQLWNVSDGGHFENMGGYELIRRRLPIIVIVDAEADPDYTFQGLSDLVRKARLDFRAEVVFLNVFELDGVERDGTPSAAAAPLPAAEREYFGDLDSLRRGVWSAEPLTNVHGVPGQRYTLQTDRTRPSKAHAALARVIYSSVEDGQVQRSWLVYVKATLMGDEPEDVCHYHRGHPDFPQETTLDQFFDEAQWESYRRLGYHVGHRVLTKNLFEHLSSHPA